MSNIIPFQFEYCQVRVLSNGETPLFHARDVAAALGYTNPSEAYQTHCKSLKKLSYSKLLELGFSSPNRQGEFFIPEADVFRLVMRSKLEGAERFQDWVCEEVLPSIRKAGGYSVKPPTAIAASKEFRALFGIARLIGYDKNVAAISANQAVASLTGTDVLGLLGATHLEAEQQHRWYTPTDLGKEIGVSGRRFNQILELAGLQKWEQLGWVPTDRAEGLCRLFDTGKRHGNGTSVSQLKWSHDVLGMVDLAPA